MNGFLRWCRGVLSPVFVPGARPLLPRIESPAESELTAGLRERYNAAVNARQVFECDCGRQHPAGWVCPSDMSRLYP